MIGHWNKLILFNCLGLYTLYEGEKDLNVKIANFVKLGILNHLETTVILLAKRIRIN
jgi:hypothetical protein